MTNDKTTREVSQRLKACDFIGEYEYCYYLTPQGYVLFHKDSINDYKKDCPVYSASTLFEWLREWKKKYTDKWFSLDTYSDGTIQFEVWIEKPHIIKKFEYKTSLADMLAESIIWILTQEKENK